MRCVLTLLFLVFALLAGAAGPGIAVAAPLAADDGAATDGAPQAGLTSAEAQQLLSVLQNPQRRQQLIMTLQTLQKVMPVLTGAAPEAVKPAAKKAASKPTVALTPNSLGADVVAGAGTLMAQVDGSLAATVTSITDADELGIWVRNLGRDPTVVTTVLSGIWRLAAVLVVGFAFEFIAWRLTRRFYVWLGYGSHRAEAEAADEDMSTATAGGAADGTLSSGWSTSAGRGGLQRLRPLQSGWLLVKRLPFILLAMAVDAAPPLVFFGLATLVLATPLARDAQTRLMIAAVVNAYVVVRLLLVVARGAFCAPSPRLRLLHVSDAAAEFLTTWCRRIAVFIVASYAVLQIGALSGMTIEMQHGLGRIFGLFIHLMLVIMVLKRRRDVEAWLRGPSGGSTSVWRDLKARLASVWHVQAIVLVIMVWIVYATEISRGVGHPLHLILATMGLLILFRITAIVILGGLDKLFAMAANTRPGTRYALISARAMRYHTPLRTLLKTGLFVVFFLILFQSWGVDAYDWFEVGGLGGRLISSLGTILVTLIIAVIVWETINFVTQIYMDDLSLQGAYVRAARLRTVLPVLRNTLLIALLVVITLTALSEIGVNIAPLLAGASIIGVAIGFGSQKLVQDFITGIFLLLENAMQVGDSVTAAGLSGTVENLSIRTLRLRAGDGSVHLIPFSSVSTVTNSNRGLGNASISVTVSYEEDTDAVAEILKRIALDMRQDDGFKDAMLSDLQLWGVDKVDGATATLVGQVVCTDGGRWGVQREFNRRIKIAFQEKGVRMMPSASVMGFQHPLDVRVEMPEMPVRPAEARPVAAPPAEARPDAARPDAARPRRAGGSGS